MSSSLRPGQPASVMSIVSADSIVELARNTVNPVTCDWGAGTRTECNIQLGSWMLLKKHLHLIHCHQTRDGYVCKLLKCNCSLHFSQQALLDHVDSAHLSRMPLICPIPDCTSPNFGGADSLVKHFEKEHGDLKGKVIKLPVTDVQPSMKDNVMSVYGQKLPPLPRKGEIQPGSALVMNVHIKQKKGFGDNDEWFGSQPEMSQSQGFTLSQGQVLIARRQRTRSKQLEKVKKEADKNEEEEGVASIVLDDLTSFGLANGPRIEVDTRHRRSQWVGMRGRGSSWESMRSNPRLATMVEEGMVFGQKSQRLMADLSRPQSMLEPEVLSRGGEEARAPQSILFDVAARKVDERENLTGAASTSR